MKAGITQPGTDGGGEQAGQPPGQGGEAAAQGGKPLPSPQGVGQQAYRHLDGKGKAVVEQQRGDGVAASLQPAQNQQSTGEVHPKVGGGVKGQGGELHGTASFPMSAQWVLLPLQT